MIATILPNASGFPAVNYNEKKVLKGKATLLEISNFGKFSEMVIPSSKDLSNYLEEYSSRNSRIKKPQFHLSISCKGDEMTHQQLLDFAHSYLKEMGYGNPEQPLLIYAHSDTENNHLHIITSRVAPDGRKVDDHNERRKSQKVLEKLQGENARLKAEDAVQLAMGFNFKSVTQFKSILESMNYECYENEGKIMVKKGGMVQTSVPLTAVQKQVERNGKIPDETNYNMLNGIFRKYRSMNTDIKGLKEDLHKKFGIGLVFFGKKDSPYGYVAVDFKNKNVYEGAKIMSVKDLFDMKTPEEQIERINHLIDSCFEDNPDITTKELNKRLKHMNARLKKDTVYFGSQQIKIKRWMADNLNINNKLAFINSFGPINQKEMEFLAKRCNLNYKHLHNVKINTFEYPKATQHIIKNLREMGSSQERYGYLRGNGFRIITYNDITFAYNPHQHILLDLSRLKINVKNQIRQTPQVNLKPMGFGGMLRADISSSGSTGENREWEVGTKEDLEKPSGYKMSY